MNTKTIAVLAVLVLLVPLSVMAVQSESDAVGETEETAIELKDMYIHVGETGTIQIKNNESAYTSYDSYTMAFSAKTTDKYSDIVTFGSSTTSSQKDIGDVTVDVARTANKEAGCFDLKISGDSDATPGDKTVYVKCLITVNPATGVVITDEVYYKVTVHLSAAITTGNITFGTIPQITVGDDVDEAIPVNTPSSIDGMQVYATGLPAGLNIVIDNGVLKLTGMTNGDAKKYSVDVVLRDSSGNEYIGEFVLTVAPATVPQAGYTVTIQGASKDTTEGSNDWYVLQDVAENVTLTVTGTNSVFGGTVEVISEVDGVLKRAPLGGTTTTEANAKKYDLTLTGVGEYVIEITDINGIMETYSVHVLPVSTGYGAGFAVVGA